MTSSGLPSYKAPYTEEIAIEFTSKVVDKCNELKDLSNLDTLGPLLKSFATSYFDFKLYRKKTSEVLLRKGFVTIASTIIQNLMKRSYFSCDQVWFPTYHMYNLLWNFSDASQEIATSLNDTDIPKAVVANVLYKPYLENLDSTNTYFLIKASVSIIHNTARFPGNQGPYNIKELKTVLVGLIKRNHSDFLGIVSMLALSVLVNETELSLLEEGKDTITSLVEHIKSAQNKPEKSFNGFMIWELVNALRCISANDNMKKMIVEKGGLEVLVSVLRNPSNDDDIEKSLGAVWNLCFDQEIRKTLDRDFDLKDMIKPFERSTSLIIKKCYDGIFWLLDSKTKSVERVKSASATKLKSSLVKESFKFDIFFSYAWANKTAVISIKDELVKSKIRVWIDFDQMKGSTLEAMADGIESSKLFVIAVSEAYRTSPNCRTEAEYAYSLKKTIVPLVMDFKYKPTSWLGLIIGSKTYYEFSERRVFQETLTNLIKNIGDLLNGNVEVAIVPRLVSTTQREQTDVPFVKGWSKVDVEKWLTNSQMSAFKSRFADIDGLLLSSMIEICSVAPDYFYQTLKVEFEMKLVDILRFNVAMRKLSPN